MARGVAASLLLLLAAAVASAAEVPPLTPPAVADPAGTRNYQPFLGDLIRFDVFDNADLSTTVRITPAGSFTFPLIGEVKIGDRAIEQVVAEIRSRLENGYIRQAPLTATVVEFGPRLAYVMGAVGRQDAVKLNPFVETTAMQAVGQVGGFLPEANRNAALVIRDDPQHPGIKLTLRLPATDNPEALAKDVILQPGDIITVPRMDRVFILGRVKTVSAVNLPSQEKLTVSKAISLAGGFELYAKQDQVQLIRGGETVRVVDVRGLLNGSVKSEDPVLQPGDTIFVPESHF